MTYQFEQALERMHRDQRIAGMAVALTDRTHTLWAKGFGAESMERPRVFVTAQSLFRIASITKIVSGSTILRLVEEGLLSLDTPIREYLPWLTLSRPEATEQMTLRHLLSHTAGLPTEYTPDGPREESALEPRLRECLPTLPLATLPAEGVHHYSNWGLHLASHIAERVTGQRFTALAKAYILDPLGMTDTTFDLRVAATHPLALPHERDESGAPTVAHYIKENAARMAAGGLYSNATDLCRLARYLLNDGKNDKGEQVVPASAIREMRREHAKVPPIYKDGYGLTMRIHRYGDKVLYGHLGSAPPYSSSLFTDPVSGYGIAVLINTECDDLRYAIPEMILDELTT